MLVAAAAGAATARVALSCAPRSQQSRRGGRVQEQGGVMVYRPLQHLIDNQINCC
jgi:hypothetical protein